MDYTIVGKFSQFAHYSSGLKTNKLGVFTGRNLQDFALYVVLFVTLTGIPALRIKPAASSPAGKLKLHINAVSKRTSSGSGLWLKRQRIGSGKQSVA
jgi:hypothetical protein